MDLHGKQILGGDVVAAGSEEFFGVDPADGSRLEPRFVDATQEEIDHALALAIEAIPDLKHVSPDKRAAFLEAVADGLEALGDALIERASRETGLPPARLVGERGRTCAQLRLFAGVVREGSWVAASVDHAQPDREPIPKPDVRRMLVPLGPVVVFGASNFPLAYSVAGGDTASALAAGCPVIVKGHPNHPGTSEMVGEVMRRVVAESNLPAGTFSLIQGKAIEVGVALVRHPSSKAVGFTGSLVGGRALFDIAASRPEPIPVFAEMGSTNPVFLLPSVVAKPELADTVHQSVTLGVGQFCTNPGILVAVRSDVVDAFAAALAEKMAGTASGTMLHAGIRAGYAAGLERVRGVPGVRESASEAADGACQAGASLFVTDGDTWLANPTLGEEVFGPATILIQCADAVQMQLVAENFAGQLTASIHGSVAELQERRGLLDTLESIAGRVIVNGMPTGVEVCASMVHGGPYPATTDSRTTSVGHAAIDRFARPVSFQNMPEELLPEALKDRNPMCLMRFVDGEWTREPS